MQIVLFDDSVCLVTRQQLILRHRHRRKDVLSIIEHYFRIPIDLLYIYIPHLFKKNNTSLKMHLI